MWRLSKVKLSRFLNHGEFVGRVVNLDYKKLHFLRKYSVNAEG